MIRWLLRRMATLAGVLALLSAVVYVGVDLLPGDPATARLGATAGPEAIAEARSRLSLDESLPARYTGWLAGLVTGDLGTSASGRPVTEMVSERLGNSALLAALAMAALIPASLALGVWAGWRPGRCTDRVISVTALLAVSVPEFVIAGALVVVFAVGLGWLPAVSVVPAGSSPLADPSLLVLPVASLTLLGLAYSVRLIRAATAAALREPHVEFAELNGARPRSVLRHAVLPAVLPVAVQVWLVIAVALVGGAVLVEQVYGYPGIGTMLVGAVATGDLPVVQAVAMLLGAAMLLALVAADALVRLLTPRLRTAPW